MKRTPKATQTLFKKWGKEGGKTRAKGLSAARRRLIASQAARARWGKTEPASPMSSIRLDNPSLKDPVYLEEILAEGGLDEWRQLYHQIADHPFGETAHALQKVVGSVEIYGATKLWKSLLNHLQGGMNA